MLEIVTITGADDHTEPSELVDIWRHFPYVEWGILIGSGTRIGASWRFPSAGWIDRLVEARKQAGGTMRLSLHLCGDALRTVARGALGWLPEYVSLRAFRRVQLNWHGMVQPEETAGNLLRAFDGKMWDPQIICQLDGVVGNQWIADELVYARGKDKVVGLHDRSHGAGVMPQDWALPSSTLDVGWAGGLGPDNLKYELPRIQHVALPDRPWWIDMETKVRTTSCRALNLTAVIRCLELAQPYVSEAAKKGGVA